MKKLRRKIKYWKNYLLYGREDAIFWDEFANFTDRMLDIMEEMDK